jgi:hypothetical protein
MKLSIAHLQLNKNRKDSKLEPRDIFASQFRVIKRGGGLTWNTRSFENAYVGVGTVVSGFGSGTEYGVEIIDTLCYDPRDKRSIQCNFSQNVKVKNFKVIPTTVDESGESNLLVSFEPQSQATDVMGELRAVGISGDHQVRLNVGTLAKVNNVYINGFHDIDLGFLSSLENVVLYSNNRATFRLNNRSQLGYTETQDILHYMRFIGYDESQKRTKQKSPLPSIEISDETIINNRSCRQDSNQTSMSASKTQTVHFSEFRYTNQDVIQITSAEDLLKLCAPETR